jgi:hypothetical protein
MLMTIDTNLSAALIDNSDTPGWSGTRILGRRLRQFSLWHRLLLRAIDSPFIRAGEATMRDLRVAVAICELPFGVSKTNKPAIRPFLLHCWAVARLLFSWKGRTAKGDLNALQRMLQGQIEKFMIHCGDYLQNPEYCIHKPDTGSAPSQPRVPRGTFTDEFEKVTGLILMGIPERRAWEMPIGLANHYYIAWLRDKGLDISITTPDEKAWREQLPKEYQFN